MLLGNHVCFPAELASRVMWIQAVGLVADATPSGLSHGLSPSAPEAGVGADHEAFVDDDIFGRPISR